MGAETAPTGGRLGINSENVNSSRRSTASNAIAASCHNVGQAVAGMQTTLLSGREVRIHFDRVNATPQIVQRILRSISAPQSLVISGSPLPVKTSSNNQHSRGAATPTNEQIETTDVFCFQFNM